MNVPRMIPAREVMVGDTIVWSSTHPTDKLCYMVVEDIEEGESTFYDYTIDNGTPIYFENNPYPALVFRGTVMCRGKVRTSYPSYPNGYSVYVEGTYLLVNRKNEQ